MKLNSKFFKERLSIIKQDSNHWWVVCNTPNDGELRFVSDNAQFCRRCMDTESSVVSKSNGVSYTFAAYNLWKECLLANGIAFSEKVRKIKNLNDLCKALNDGEPIDLSKIYEEHPEFHDIPDPESVLICHDGKTIVISENGKCVTRKYKKEEVEKYFNDMKKSDL